MINLSRYQEKGILLSYVLNPDVAEIIIHYLKVADRGSEIKFREKNQTRFKGEHDWNLVMGQLRIHGDQAGWFDFVYTNIGARFLGYAPMMPVMPSRMNHYTQRNQVGFRVRRDPVRDHSEVWRGYRSSPSLYKKVPFTNKIKHGERMRRNHHKEMNRSNRMITKHMNNR